MESNGFLLFQWEFKNEFFQWRTTINEEREGDGCDPFSFQWEFKNDFFQSRPSPIIFFSSYIYVMTSCREQERESKEVKFLMLWQNGGERSEHVRMCLRRVRKLKKKHGIWRIRHVSRLCLCFLGEHWTLFLPNSPPPQAKTKQQNGLDINSIQLNQSLQENNDKSNQQTVLVGLSFYPTSWP